ncbi:hypothetical protein PRIPAC_73176 [Pristionchus pacificus]|uniref:Uncharacterized protein n=1 Tax=Pristionchus pacificus TaxID=54126 RepID=A0A2A6C8D4_PRIPA|nr:hypothetical protein PRIPAC_73176 [Pristionchus pacificus]|eukprot:PDM74444.1 hypothetical protein PRIPAC_41800 [Pristionchus pacificus]
MRPIKECVALFTLFILSDSTCFIEEQSTTIMRAYRILTGVESYRTCQIYCQNDPECVTVSYSDTMRICHLQVPSHYSTCNPHPYRRWVKTEQNCIGSIHPGTYRTFARTAFATMARIRAFPIRHFSIRNWALDGNGTYSSFGNSKEVRTYFSTTNNAYMLRYYKDPTMTFPYWLFSATCAEEGDECPCGLLPLHPTIVGTRPAVNVVGACPTPLKLYAIRTKKQAIAWKGSALYYFLVDKWAEVCESTCFHEEQSTTPMIALRILNNIGSWLLCVKECFNDAQCVSVAYSDLLRVCHLHKTVGLSACNVVPFRRWVKTETNCQATAAATTGAFYAVDFIRTDPSLEMGIDPCFPDRSRLHPELVVLDGVSPPCPLTDGSPWPSYTFRGLDITGAYYTWGVSNLVQAGIYPADNTVSFTYRSHLNTVHQPGCGIVSCLCIAPRQEIQPAPAHRSLCIPVAVQHHFKTLSALAQASDYSNVIREALAPVDVDGNTAMLFCSVSNNICKLCACLSCV